jgi:hypothetical protein
MANVISLDVGDTGMVTFRVKAPAAQGADLAPGNSGQSGAERKTRSCEGPLR